VAHSISAEIPYKRAARTLRCNPGMLAKIASTAAVALTFLSLACGGREDTSLLPICPSDGTCTGDCKVVSQTCEGTQELACTCDASGVHCPEIGTPACQQDCNSLAEHMDMTCSVEGEVCPSPDQTACGYDSTTPLTCTCSSGQFVCEAPTCPPPSPSKCPPPSEVVPGGSCQTFLACDSDQPVLDCQGKSIGTVGCTCIGGHWSGCYPLPPPCADAGTPDGG
jgi:hypothetical protein